MKTRSWLSTLIHEFGDVFFDRIFPKGKASVFFRWRGEVLGTGFPRDFLGVLGARFGFALPMGVQS
jgi:hypothetical protein